jgi:hypothetical protein
LVQPLIKLPGFTGRSITITSPAIGFVTEHSLSVGGRISRRDNARWIKFATKQNPVFTSCERIEPGGGPNNSRSISAKFKTSHEIDAFRVVGVPVVSNLDRTFIELVATDL